MSYRGKRPRHVLQGRGRISKELTEYELEEMGRQCKELCQKLTFPPFSTTKSLHKCDTKCRWSSIPGNNVYICEESGNIHYCTDKCNQRIEMDVDVCPISSIVFKENMIQLGLEEVIGSRRVTGKQKMGNYNVKSKKKLLMKFNYFNGELMADESSIFESKRQKKLQQISTETRDSMVYICFKDDISHLRDTKYSKGLQTLIEQIVKMCKTLGHIPLDVISLMVSQFRTQHLAYQYDYALDQEFCEEVITEAMKWRKIIRENPDFVSDSINSVTERKKKKRKPIKSSFSLRKKLDLGIAYLMKEGPVVTDPRTKETLPMVPKSEKAAIYLPDFKTLSQLKVATKSHTKTIRDLKRIIYEWTIKQLK